MMNLLRVSAVMPLYRPVVLACVFAWLAAFGSARVESTDVVAIVDRAAPALLAAVEFADAPRADAIDHPTATRAEVSAEEQTLGAAAETTAALGRSEPAIQLARADSSQQLPMETPAEQAVKASTQDQLASDGNETAGPVDVVDECFVLDICVDRYLWALYQRTPKEDSIRVSERRKLTVKRKGKMVTVTRTYTKLVDENFAWKDPKAAEKAGMWPVDYVIGGMDRSFKLRLFQMLHAADAASLSPGITSAFRDDYRQSIATGLKAASDRSYHGGSFRGGYGHGLAADVVSVNGGTRAQRLAATEGLWRWIDEHGKEFGIGRPYLDKDPPHLAPIDGEEYAKHNPGAATRAESGLKTRQRQAVRDDHVARHQGTARSSKVKTI
jgi:hypothetical protein